MAGDGKESVVEMEGKETMKALSLYGVNDLRLVDMPRPEPGDGEVLLKIKACGICGSDIPRVFTKGTYHFPTVIGHEFAGEIIEAEDKSIIGRGASVFPLLPCGTCDVCHSGHYAQCSHYDYYGSRRDGGMAEYLAVKRENVVLMPEGVSYEAAAMSEPASVALHAFKKAELKRDDTIVIFGVGPIGLIAANWAREAGASHIIMVARSQAKKEFAERLGFVDTVDSNETDVSDFVRRRTRGNGADAAIEGTGTSECLEQALFCVRNFGRVVTMGNPLGDMQLSQQGYWQILRKELKLCGTWNSSFSSSENDWLEVMDAMKSHAVDLEALISHRFKLRDYEQAFRLMHEKLEPYCKVMFVMDD